MDRRNFLKVAALSAPAAALLTAPARASSRPTLLLRGLDANALDGATLLCSFARDDGDWQVWQDFRRRDGDITGISGDMPLFCTPAQMTLPLLVRWMLIF